MSVLNGLHHVLVVDAAPVVAVEEAGVEVACVGERVGEFVAVNVRA